MDQSLPLWLQISKQIEYDIDCGKYAVGEILPNEFEMCRIYAVSRVTIRGAMARLKDLGKIDRIKGKGTLVTHTKVKEPLLKIGGFTDEMKDKGIIPSTSYAHIERKHVSGYIAELFHQNKSTFFTVLERIRCINDVAVGYFITYLPEELKLEHRDSLYYSSLYNKLEAEFGLKIDYVKQTVSAELADKKTREMLNLSPGEAVIVMKRQAFVQGKLIEYSVCKYDGKRYEYNMELKSKGE